MFRQLFCQRTKWNKNCVALPPFRHTPKTTMYHVVCVCVSACVCARACMRAFISGHLDDKIVITTTTTISAFVTINNNNTRRKVCVTAQRQICLFGYALHSIVTDLSLDVCHFQTPRGVQCPGRQLTKKFPMVPNDAFSFTTQVLDVNGIHLSSMKVTCVPCMSV